MSQFSIREENNNHKWRTEIPNIVFSAGLKAIQFFVYSAIKKSAGDNGNCTKSSKTLSEICNCSKKTLLKTIQELTEINPFLGRPLISCTHRATESGDKDTNFITITNLWDINFDLEGGGVKITPRGEKFTPGVEKNLHQGGVKFTHKQEPLKKNPIKEQQRSVVVILDCLREIQDLKEEDKIALSKFPQERVLAALEYIKTAKIKTTLIATLIWHCQQPEIIQPKKKPINLRKEVRKKFPHGSEHNAATCYHDGEVIRFERGNTGFNLHDKEQEYEEKLNKILDYFNLRM